MKENTIISVVINGLCTGCGTCISFCPTKAIELRIDEKKATYVPHVNENWCIECRFCINVCPGRGFDFKTMNKDIFGREPENVLIGNYVKCYTGNSNNLDIRYNSASGGLVTQLLIFALDEGLINGALVTKMNTDKPLEPEPFIARTKEEIIEASKSKYCPVPANIALQKILDAKEGERFAVVGLPCHIQGIRKAEQMNKKLREKIVLHLGLFCTHTPNFWATKIYLQKSKIREDEVVDLSYRGEGYPGKMKIYTKNGITTTTLSNYWSFIGSKFFYPQRCLLCSDGICEFSDITFGDAWLPEFSHEKIGKSIFISQNEIGENLIKNANLKKKIEIHEIPVNRVIESQTGMLHFKKKNLNARVRLFKFIPEHNASLKADSLDYFFALYCFMNSYVSSILPLRLLLRYIPLKIIWIYTIVYSLLYSKKARHDIRKISGRLKGK